MADIKVIKVKELLDNTLGATEYCKANRKEQWQALVCDAIAKVQDEESYDPELDVLDDAATIMRYLNEGATWEDIKKYVSQQGYGNYGFFSLAYRMLQFSPSGIEYATNIVGRKIIESIPGLSKFYDDMLAERVALSGKTSSL